MTAFPDLAPALPELVLLAAALILLMVGAFGRETVGRTVSWGAEIALIGALVAVVSLPPGTQETFEGLFITDGFARFMKALVLIGALLTLIMGQGFRDREGMTQFEFPVLILFATLGMLLMVSANDLMALYLGLELQSLALYVIAAIKRDSQKASESGLKYFVLSALSSGLLLYGCSLIYGFTGATSFDGIARAIGTEGVSTGLMVGMVFLAAGLAFKVSAVPFHMWTPDVYEGAATPVTAFFAAAPKVAAIALLVRVLIDPLGGMIGEWRQLIVFVSIASMVVGAFAAIYQTNIKRLMAYSSIGNIGYALAGLAAGTADGVGAVLIYMAIYLVMTIGAFACILAMRVRGEMVERISDLAGVGRTHPLLAFGLAALMFSLAGIPPLAGFFGKLYVFLAVIEAGLYTLAIIGLLTSVVGAFYYLRIVKLMYFDDATEAFDRPIGGEVAFVATLASVFVLFFFAYPSPIVAGAMGGDRGHHAVITRLPPGITLIDLDTVGSTNDEARQRAEAGADAWTVVRARIQDGGRGRRGRDWASPAGNLYMSVILRPDCAPERAAGLSFVVALAVSDALASALPPMAELTLKWPNDVLVNDRKIAGILLESANRPDGAVDWLIAGIGINIVSHPESAAYDATDLHFEGAVDANPDTVMSALARGLMLWTDRWRADGFAPIRRAWLARARGLGAPIEVRLERETLRGTFADLDESGALVIDMAGERRLITAGDVFPAEAS